MSAPTMKAQALVDAQAEDEGLWFVAATAPEAYLQAALRDLHAAVEQDAAAAGPGDAPVLDLSDRAVQKRLAAQWGFVERAASAPSVVQAEPGETCDVCGASA